jgi:SAM-dependent methyltransferase
MLSKLKFIFEREQFQPSWLGLFVNPFYFARKGLYENIAHFAPQVTGHLLDIGCGRKPYQNLFNVTLYSGLEIDTADNRRDKNADYYYDGSVLPFNNGAFDGVIINEVFEHVFTPDSFLREVNRVLKVDGTLFMTVPFVWDEHEQPYDFARYSSYGLRSLIELHGFSIIEQHKSIADIRVIFQLINTYIYKVTASRNRCWNLLVMLLFIAPTNIVGELLAKILPDNKDLYLDNIVLAKKAINA